ncbi:MAG: hypothetical protein QOJ20_4486 [Mycobacterium sp.]|nr:hypothetical protein [Mycobacterium sp.]
MFRQPRHVGDAFRRCVGLRTADAGGAVPVRRGGHRSGRRLCPDCRQTGGHFAALGTRNGERVGEPAQRSAGAQPSRQRRRRPCHLSPEARCATAIRHRRTGQLADRYRAPTRLRRRARRCGGRGDFQRDLIAAYRHAHPSCGPVVERVGIRWRGDRKRAADHARAGDRQASLPGICNPRGCRKTDRLNQDGRRTRVPRVPKASANQGRAVRRADTGGRRHHRRRECTEIASRTYGPTARRACDHRRGVARGGPHLRCDRRQGARADLSRPAHARQRRTRYPTLGLLRRAGTGTAEGDKTFDAGRSAVTGDVLRVSEHGE